MIEPLSTEQVAPGSKPVSYFRGYWSIKEVADKMAKLADWMLANRPSCRHMTLLRKDYDLVKRWPKASSLHGITVPEEGPITFRGFTLGHDKKPARYAR